MTEEAGQESPTGTDAGQAAALLAENKDLKDQLTRLRGTQGSQDRALEHSRTSEAELKAKLTDIEVAHKTVLTDLEQFKATNAALTEKLNTLTPLESQVTQLSAQAERYRIAASMAGTSPAISLLVETGALPQTETTEDFKAALEKIAGGLSTYAGQQATQMLSGGRPSSPPAVDETPDSLMEKSMKLMNSGKRADLDEALRLRDQALALQTKPRS
jgi:phage shock protein A